MRLVEGWVELVLHEACIRVRRSFHFVSCRSRLLQRPCLGRRPPLIMEAQPGRRQCLVGIWGDGGWHGRCLICSMEATMSCCRGGVILGKRPPGELKGMGCLVANNRPYSLLPPPFPRLTLSGLTTAGVLGSSRSSLLPNDFPPHLLFLFSHPPSNNPAVLTTHRHKLNFVVVDIMLYHCGTQWLGLMQLA